MTHLHQGTILLTDERVPDGSLAPDLTNQGGSIGVLITDKADNQFVM